MLMWLVLALQWALLAYQCRRSGTAFSAAQQLPFLAVLVASVLWQRQREGWVWTGPVALGAIVLAYFVGTTHAERLRRHEAKPLAPKDASKSSVVYRYKMSPAECDEHGRVYGGELLKLIDVSAGLVAAKHAGGPCLTISADRVIFLEEIRVGDVISLSSAVNRAWGSSMEIGVRVMRQSRTDPLGPETYCSHAYLTFVAKSYPPPPPGPLLSVTDTLGLTRPPKPRRAQLPGLKPSSLLEQKRYLLAGRRRAHRIKQAKENDRRNRAFQEQIYEIERESRVGAPAAVDEQFEDRKALLGQLQVELLSEMFMRGESDVRIEGDEVVGEIEGFVEPVRVKKALIDRAVLEKGHGGWHKISLATDEDVDRAAGHTMRVSLDPHVQAASDVSSVPFEATLSMGLWIVRPQHCNSKSILFGGTLMRWVEEVSTIAARRVYPTASWSSAAIDSLTFKTAVQPGEVVYVRAAVIKVFDSSLEVAAVVTCEDRNSPSPKIREVSESFFTLVAMDPLSGRPLKGVLRHIELPPSGPVTELASLAQKRREDRLLDKRILQRVYA
ncbi:acyl-CoA thioesteraes 11 [Rhodotorula toruloides]|uniref:Acyl-CoA thioesteraes 11 n=1 Tax=Rhodotorula toruloides TaxID=5286 RepID=A0A511KAN4_RHOTO|nr:acyl-CoA thioesteraes 11 [Rhodotorula toruloides]